MKKIVLSFGAVGVFIIVLIAGVYVNNKNAKADTLGLDVSHELNKSDYNLDQLYEFVINDDFREFNHRGISYIYTHFYDYFNMDTKFLVVSDYDNKNNKVLHTKYITYDEYMEHMQPIYEKLNAQGISKDDYTVWDSAAWSLIRNDFLKGND